MVEQILYRYNPWWEDSDFKAADLIQRKQAMEALENRFSSNRVILITGIRRIGKTSLLKLFIDKLLNANDIPSHKIFYVSLDDYMLTKLSILEIIEHYRAIHKLKFEEKVYLFLDEITYKENYQLQLKNLVDQQNVKIIATSSSAAFVRQGKSLLTGRETTLELMPLDFHEYLSFNNVKLKKKDSHLKKQYFNDFLKTGGVPEYVLTGNTEYARELVDDILYKDIIAHRHIKDEQLIKDYFLLLMERAGKRLSINKIASILSISPDSSRKYLQYFADSYLIHLVRRYGKTNERILAPNKIYAADLGIRNIFTGYRDFGSLFENYVYLRTKHLNPQYIYKEQTEIDFVFPDYKIVAEVKYHHEELPEKQRKLMESYNQFEFKVIRNENHINEFLDKTNSS